MRAVAFQAGGGEPLYGDFAEPRARGTLTAVAVKAAALTNLDALIAGGRHAFSPKEGTAVAGCEGVVLSPSGDRLYLTNQAIAQPFGSMAERTLADLSRALSVLDGVPDVVAAALGNAGLAAWLPLSWRGRLAPGETVLVLGATGTSGRIAVMAAKRLGAGRVVAAGRDRAVLDELLDQGADAIVHLDGEADLPRAMLTAAAGRVDVVLDYLNGSPAEAALDVMAIDGRMVQIGSVVAPATRLPALTARVFNLEVLGFAYHHAPIALQQGAYTALCRATLDGALRLPVRSLPLEQFDVAWAARVSDPRTRHVLIP